jgi:hypothetical protein
MAAMADMLQSARQCTPLAKKESLQIDSYSIIVIIILV